MSPTAATLSRRLLLSISGGGAGSLTAGTSGAGGWSATAGGGGSAGGVVVHAARSSSSNGANRRVALVTESNAQHINIGLPELIANQVQPVEILYGPDAYPVISPVVNRNTLNDRLDAQ